MYNQIFRIHGSVGKFATCYEQRGYLPALELPEEQTTPDLSNRYVLNELEKVKAEANHLYMQTISLLDRNLDKKKKRNYIDYEVEDS